MYPLYNPVNEMQVDIDHMHITFILFRVKCKQMMCAKICKSALQMEHLELHNILYVIM